jgi:uncharacterized membrane protein
VSAVRVVYLFALAVWIGEVVFFSFVVAPRVFATLEPARAGDVVGAIFPPYYALGLGAAGLAVLAGTALRARARHRRAWSVAVAALALGLVATAWAGLGVHPRAQRLRGAAVAAGRAPAEDAAFRDAHRLAVVLNGVALLGGVVGLGVSAVALRA